MTPALRLIVISFFWFGWASLAQAAPHAELDQPELQTLKDASQEPRTTSLNWTLGRANRAWAPKPKVPSFRVMIDAGHGGKDKGALGLYGIAEKEYCLKLSQLLRRELERVKNRKGLNIEVALTRDEDVYLGLRERVKRANDWEADVFVSLHLNSSPVSKVRGFEVYFLSQDSTDEEARKLARLENSEQFADVKSDVLSILSDVQSSVHILESSALAENLFQSISRKIRSNGRGVRQAPFTVLAGTSMPAVLVEVGYVTHPEDARQLSSFSYLKRIAGAISTGIVEYALQRKKLS